MALEAELRHGNPDLIQYTPAAGALTAGQVVLYGNTAGLTCIIARGDIANNTAGAAYAGGGFFSVTNLDNAANGAKVWWNDSVNKVTTTSTNNALFGFVAENGGGGANTTCIVRHFPYV